MSELRKRTNEFKSQKESKVLPESKEEVKDGESSTVQLDKNVVPKPLGASPGTSMSGLPMQVSNNNKPFKTRMSASGNLQSSAIGVLSGVISTNPTATSFTELTALQGLYAECKLVKVALTLFNYNPDFDSAVGGVESGPLPIAWVPDTVTTPTSVAAVWGVGNCKIFGLSSKRGMTISFPVTGRSYASFASGSYAPGPYAGLTGTFIYYQSGLSNSNTYVGWFLEMEVMLRQRI